MFQEKMSNLNNSNQNSDTATGIQESDCLSVERQKRIKEIILNRRSCRSFLSKPIKKSDLLELVEAGTYAPSGSNSQNQRFLIVDDPQEIQQIGHSRWVWPYKSNVSQEKLRSREPSGILGKATALILVFADSSLNDRRNTGEYYIWESLEIQNCAASIQNILLLATAKGIASCWVSCSKNMTYSRLLSDRSWQEVLKGYEIPMSYKIQGLITLGYPKQIDENGFPKGERVHGVVPGSTHRKEVSEYLIKKNSEDDKYKHEVGKLDKLKLFTYTFLIKVMLDLVKVITKKVYTVEKKYLKSLP